MAKVIEMKGGWKSAAEVESVGEVASEGARYLRFLEMGDGGEGRVSWFCLSLQSQHGRHDWTAVQGQRWDVPAGCFGNGSVLVFWFLAGS